MKSNRVLTLLLCLPLCLTMITRMHSPGNNSFSVLAQNIILVEEEKVHQAIVQAIPYYAGNIRPDYVDSIIGIKIDGQWAYSLVQWDSGDNSTEQLVILAHKLPNGIWETSVLENPASWLNSEPVANHNQEISFDEINIPLDLFPIIWDRTSQNLSDEHRIINAATNQTEINLMSSATYAVLYHDNNTAFVVTPDNPNPTPIGSSFAAPDTLIYSLPTKTYGDSITSGIELSEGYEFISGIYDSSSNQITYVESTCSSDEDCGSNYNVYKLDIATQEKELLITDSMFEGLFPEPVSWNESRGVIFFDTYNLIKQTPHSGLWRYDLASGELHQIDLGDNGYNSRFWTSPDGQFLLTTSSPFGMETNSTGHLTSQIKVLDTVDETVSILAQHPEDGELFVQGWVSYEHLEDLTNLASDEAISFPAAVSEATSGFQRPMTNDHYGWEWLDWTGTVYHPGDDYNGPGSGNADCGLPIYAVATGTVRHVNLGGWGTLVIEHQWQGTTVFSQYGHIGSARVTNNQTVNRGDHIANVGNTGTTTCHLHWEIRESDHPNPTDSAYYTTAILNQSSNVNNYYEDPEWWVDTHGSYNTSDCSNYSFNGIVLFDNKNCLDGSPLSYSSSTGLINLPQIGWNDRVSSIYVDSGWSVKTYQHDNGGGASRCVSWSFWDLTQDYFTGSSVNMNNEISSIQVFNNDSCTNTTASQVKLYSEPNMGGSVLHSLGTGLHNDPNPPIFSMSMPTGWSAITYDQDNGAGDSRCWNSNVNNFQDHSDWQNRLRSIRIYSYNACPVAPAIPINLSVSGTTADSISLVWQDNSNNETGFRIYRWGYNGTNWEFMYLDSVGANATNYTNTNLQCNTTYFYEISAYGSGGESNHTPFIEVSTDACPQPGPLSIDHYTIDDDTINESSGNNDGLVNCGETIELYLSLHNAGGDATGVNASISTNDSYVTWLFNTTSSYPDINAGQIGQNNSDFDFALSSQTPHNHSIIFTLQITATNGGTWTDSVSVPVTCSVPNPPSNLTVSNANQDALTINWQDNSNNETGFHIYKWGYNGTNWEFLYHDSVDNDVTTYTDMGLTCGTIYYYKVSAYSNNGESALTGWVDGQTLTCPQPGPLSIDHYTIDDDTINESSGNNDGLVNCGETIELYLSLHNAGGDATGVNASISTNDSYVTWLFNTTSSYPDINAGQIGQNNSDFDFALSSQTPHNHSIIFTLQITATNGGTWTDSVSVPVTCSVPNPPSNLTVSNANQDALTINWQDNSNNETGFHIYKWGYNGTNWEFLYHDSVDNDVTTYTDMGLTCGTIYYYKVSAYSNNGESVLTGWVDGQTLICPPVTSTHDVYLPIIIGK